MPMGIGLGIGVTRGGGVGWWPAGSELALEFDNQRGFNSIDRTKTTPDSILTYTNPSAKLVYGSDGVLRYAPHNLFSSSEDITPFLFTNATKNSATTFTFNTADGYIRRSIIAAQSRFKVKVVISGNTPGDTFLMELIDGTDGSDAATTVVTISTAPQEFTITANMAVSTFSGSLLLALNRVGTSRSVTVGSSVTIHSVHLFYYPCQDETYIPTTTAAVYSLPIDHNPTTFAPLGVLIEEQRVNLCLYSDDFTNAAWVKSNLTAAKTATGPDGVANSASTLTATAAWGAARQSITSASAARISSLYVKRRTGTGAVSLSQGEAGTNALTDDFSSYADSAALTAVWTAGGGATVTLQTGTMRVLRGASTGYSARSFTTVAGIRYKVSYRVAAVGVGAGGNIRVGTTVANNDLLNGAAGGVGSYVTYFVATGTTTWVSFLPGVANGDQCDFDDISVDAIVETALTVTSDWTRVNCASATITDPIVVIKLATSGDAIDVALFQHELGAFITSPVPTVASQVTRAADQVSILTSAFGYNALESTMVAEYRAPSLAFSQDIVWIADGLAESLGLYTLPNNAVILWTRDGGMTQTTPTIGIMTGTTNKAAAAWKLNDFAGSLNGGTVAIDDTGTMPTPTELKLNPRAIASTLGNIHIKRLTYFPTRRTNADLQVLST